MKGIVQDTYGSADVLELREIEKPVVGDDDLLVRVRAAGVDTGSHGGSFGRMAGEPFNYPKKSLPRLSNKNPCKWTFLRRRRWNTHLQGCVPESPGSQRCRGKRFSPANRRKPTPGLEPGPLHYERRTGRGSASTQGHSRGRSCRNRTFSRPTAHIRPTRGRATHRARRP